MLNSVLNAEQSTLSLNQVFFVSGVKGLTLAVLLALILGASVNPVTAAGLVAGGIATVGGGVVGNRADAALLWSCQALAQALRRQESAPMREVLGKALWLSYLQALRSVCSECKAELVGQFAMQYRGQPNYPAEVRDDIHWLNGKLAQFSQQIEAIEKGDLAGVPQISWQALESFTVPTNGPTEAEQGIRQVAVAALVNSAHEPGMSALYQQKLEQIETGLFERVCGFFAQQLAQDSALRIFFENQLLMQISGDIVEQNITLQQVQQRLNDLSQVVPEQLNQALVTLESVETVQLETNERTGLILELTQEVRALIKTFIAVRGEEIQSEPQTFDATILSEDFSAGQVIAPNPFGPLGGRINDPQQFFGREPILARIFEILNSGSSVALVGGKQMGKSSLLEAIQFQAEEKLDVSREPIYIDLQHIADEDDFYYALCDHLNINEVLKGFRLTRELKSRRLLLLLDGLEKMTLDGFTDQVRGHLRGLAEGRDASLQLVVAASESLDELFSNVEGRSMTSPVDGIYLQETIHPWNDTTIRAFIRLYRELAR